MDNVDYKSLKAKADRAWEKKIAKASAKAFAFIESRPAVTFRFNVHEINPAFAPLGIRYSAANPEGEELCDLLRETFPLTRGADTSFTQAFNSLVARAREQDYLIAEPDQSDSVIAIKARGPIAVRRPLSFKKNV